MPPLSSGGPPHVSQGGKRSENDYFTQSRSMDGIGDEVGEQGAGSASVARYRAVEKHRYVRTRKESSDETSAHLR